MHFYVDLGLKTNIMIRIDAETAESAKALGLNISKISEDALAQAIAEETRPFSIVESDQVVFRANLIYVKHEETLGLGFNVLNASEENLIIDRIIYSLHLSKEIFDKPIEVFKGVALKREDVPKGKQVSMPGEGFKPSKGTVDRINEMIAKGDGSVKWVIFTELYLSSKKGIIKGKFEWKRDEKGFACLEPLLIM
jgi:antitoxin component of RelBE/YafQ-DinJ toxin-antitoxin module